MAKRIKHLTYAQQVSGTFNCPGCGCIKPERKGYLARRKLTEANALWCMPCIKDFHCIIVPEQKDPRNG